MATRDGPRYAAIVSALATDIESGVLAPGDRLPTQRALAEALAVSLGTVTRAYTEARRLGLLDGEVGRGTFVRGRVQEDTRWALDAMTDRSIIDLSLLVAPPLGDLVEGPRLRDRIAAVAREAELDEILGYQPHAGAPAHRRAGAEWVSRTGLAAEPEDVLVAASAQHAMTCVLSVVARPGDLVMTEALTAPGFKDIAGWMPIRLHGLPCDEEGLIPEAFEAACRLGISRVLYTMPVLHNPTTVTAPAERRRAIAEIAVRHGVAVIEDGVHGLLAGDGVTPLAAAAPESAYYITSLSKTIAAGLRVGFIRAPRSAVSQLEDAIRATMWMTSPLLGEVAARIIGDGTAQAILEARREEARIRRAIAAGRLDPAAYVAHPGGFHLWLDPGPGWSAETLVGAARVAGVAITPAEVFVAGRGHVPSRVRVCLSAAANREELALGVDIIGDLLASRPGSVAGA